MIRTGLVGILLVGLLSSSPALADASCGRGPKRSPASNEPAKLTIINTGQQKLYVDWLDFSGEHKNYGSVEPGKSFVQQTFVGHIWVLSTEVGNCVKQFKAKRGASVVRAALTNEDEEGGD